MPYSYVKFVVSVALCITHLMKRHCSFAAGYEMNDDDVVAIARLRGRQLHTLDVPLCCISSVEPESDPHTVGLEYGRVGNDFNAEVGRLHQ